MVTDVDKAVETPPFLKWAGGKRWLVQNHPELFPARFNRYFEPFLGSGAVYFHLQPGDAFLSDSNRELVEVYQALTENWITVVRYLELHAALHRPSYYYDIRSTEFQGLYQRAAKFLYLNRTCWNGLYRVNLEGRFNVPVGTKSTVFLPTDDFEQVSDLLQTAVVRCEDFASAVDRAQRGDFLFVDPPYTVQHNNNGFVKYNERLFGWEDQVRLRDCLLAAKRRGALVMLTNAHHDSVVELFSDLGRSRILKRQSLIASDAARRGDSEEVVITTW